MTASFFVVCSQSVLCLESNEPSSCSIKIFSRCYARSSPAGVLNSQNVKNWFANTINLSVDVKSRPSEKPESTILFFSLCRILSGRLSLSSAALIIAYYFSDFV